nr:deoxyribose-phosphate aldolase [uncultured Capnocytophaga sp.]
MDTTNIAQYIDYTLLKPTATFADIEKLCQEALSYHFFSVCVNSSYISYAKNLLKESPIKLCSVVGFPLGAMSPQAKANETTIALEEGADEIDMVMNIGWFLSGQIHKVSEEVSLIKKITGAKVLKLIIETCYLSDEQKRLACLMGVDAGADFIKTSTGFGTGGATLGDVQLMKEVIGENALIKASGGIRTREVALEYLALGVSRIGASAIII